MLGTQGLAVVITMVGKGLCVCCCGCTELPLHQDSREGVSQACRVGGTVVRGASGVGIVGAKAQRACWRE